MAEVTGLSQSQVYKWCWDQKKKQNKNKSQHSQNFHDKRKLIKKTLSFRFNDPSKQDPEVSSDDQQKQNIKCQFVHANNRRTMTKPKSSIVLADTNETEKKVNKKLIFY